MIILSKKKINNDNDTERDIKKMIQRRQLNFLCRNLEETSYKLFKNKIEIKPPFSIFISVSCCGKRTREKQQRKLEAFTCNIMWSIDIIEWTFLVQLGFSWLSKAYNMNYKWGRTKKEIDTFFSFHFPFPSNIFTKQQ